MRTLALILVLALGAQAEDRTALLERILRAEAGTPVRVGMDDKSTVTGRLLRVEHDTVQVQAAHGGAVTVRDLPIQRVASFQVLRASEFGKGFRRGAGRTLGVVGVLMALGLLFGLANN